VNVRRRARSGLGCASTLPPRSTASACASTRSPSSLRAPGRRPRRAHLRCGRSGPAPDGRCQEQEGDQGGKPLRALRNRARVIDARDRIRQTEETQARVILGLLSPPRTRVDHPGPPNDRLGNIIRFCGGAGSRTHVMGPNRNERRRGLTHQTHEIVWTSRSRSIPRRPTWFRLTVQSRGTRRAQNLEAVLGLSRRARLDLSP